MISWNNLDKLTAYKKLQSLKGSVELRDAMAGKSGKDRVAKYSIPMGGGLCYNFAAKAVNDEIQIGKSTRLNSSHRHTSRMPSSA